MCAVYGMEHQSVDNKPVSLSAFCFQAFWTASFGWYHIITGVTRHVVHNIEMTGRVIHSIPTNIATILLDYKRTNRFACRVSCFLSDGREKRRKLYKTITAACCCPLGQLLSTWYGYINQVRVSWGARQKGETDPRKGIAIITSVLRMYALLL